MQEEALREALAELEAAHEELVRIQTRLREVSARLTVAEYDDESGEPTNLAAAWQLGLAAHVNDPLDGAVRWLSQVTSWTESSFDGPID